MLDLIARQISPIVNTVLLVILFFYQKNKNKLLLERVVGQERLLKQTNDLVARQASTVATQQKVVDSAIKYSEAFDLEKLEKALRIKAEGDAATQLSAKEAEFKEQLSAQENRSKEMQEAIAKISAKLMAEEWAPALRVAMDLMAWAPAESRSAALASVPEGPIRDALVSASRHVDLARARAYGLQGGLQAMAARESADIDLGNPKD